MAKLIFIAADHAGFTLKQTLIPFLQEHNYSVEDCGAFSLEKDDDYPDFIRVAAKKLSETTLSGNTDARAIVIGGSGQGEAIVANRFKGVRCALFYGSAPHEQQDAQGEMLDMIASTRVHNDANALSLGARFLSDAEAKDAVMRWLTSDFRGAERHVRRIQKIDD